MIKACIFDMDGTVLDTITTITYYVNVTLEKLGIPHISEEQAKVFAGNGARKLIERSLEFNGIKDEKTIKEVLDSYTAAYDAEPLYLTGTFDGMAELLAGLRANGIKLGIISNKPDSAVRPIGEHFFGDSMDYVYGAREGIALKPAPDALLALLDEMGVEVSECAYIGDTGVDMMTGRAARVAMTIGVTWGFRTVKELIDTGADIVVNEPMQILDKVLSY